MSNELKCIVDCPINEIYEIKCPTKLNDFTVICVLLRQGSDLVSDLVDCVEQLLGQVGLLPAPDRVRDSATLAADVVVLLWARWE